MTTPCDNLGARVPSDLVELDAKEIEEFILENQLKRIDAKRFRRGYQAVVEAMVGVSSSCVVLFCICCLSFTLTNFFHFLGCHLFF